jgi:hypothetical protein
MKSPQMQSWAHSRNTPLAAHTMGGTVKKQQNTEGYCAELSENGQT